MANNLLGYPFVLGHDELQLGTLLNPEMNQTILICRLLLVVGVAISFVTAAMAQPVPAFESKSAEENVSGYEALAKALAAIVREAIPRNYEREEDWGRKKRITTGIRIDKLEFSRRKKEVDHGIWKRYRIELVNPAEELQVRVENLRSIGAGKAALTLVLDGKFRGWGQARVYNRGLHLITLTTEGNTRLNIRADFEVKVSATPADLFAGIQLSPIATDVQVDLREFELTRFGELHGDLARELGRGLKRVLESELDGPKLVAKINRAIDKKRDRLKVTPDLLVRDPQ